MPVDTTLSGRVRAGATTAGASLVGFADVEGLAALPRAVAIVMAHTPAGLADLKAMPTSVYYQEYLDFNARLDEIAGEMGRMIEAAGYRVSLNQATLGHIDPETLAAPFSHKMAATRAGLGWIGKSALLVTPQLGPALRLTSLLTEAPLEVGTPITESQCGECTVCREVCPGGAISGKLWRAGMARQEFYDAFACRKAALARAATRGISSTICGMCMAACPRRPR
jgi:epoxyqueuosine reductase QueG